MKKLSLIIAISIFTITSNAQYGVLRSTELAKLEGYATITNKGSSYAARIVNKTEKYVFVGASKMKVKFKYDKWSESKGEFVRRSSNKNVKFKPLFLAPNTTAERDRDRKDTDNKLYVAVGNIYTEMGQTLLGDEVDRTSESVFEATTSWKQIFENDQYKIEMSVTKKSGIFVMSGFSQYKTIFRVTNKESSNLKFSTPLGIKMYYQGVSESATRKVNKIKTGKIKTVSVNFSGCLFNFKPKIFIELTQTPS